MKAWLMAAVACLFCGTAWAQNEGHDRGPDSGRHETGPTSRAGAGMRENGSRGGHGQGQQDRGAMRGDRGHAQGGMQQDRGIMQGDRMHDNRAGHFDVQRFHGNVRAQHRFHVGGWQAPRGYRYRRWSYGQRLPSIYFGQSYWLTNFGVYGLMAPPPDAVWVRYGPDAVLVDRFSGDIIRVEYGVFY